MDLGHFVDVFRPTHLGQQQFAACINDHMDKMAVQAIYKPEQGLSDPGNQAAGLGLGVFQ